MSSAPDPYRPHVYIGATRLTGGRGSRALSALIGLTIKWGAKDWYSNVEPAELSLRLLDRVGDYLDLADEEDSLIRIVRDDPVSGPRSVIVFRGRVESSTAEHTTIQNPNTGEPEDAWIVSLSAFDPLNQMAQDRKHGQRYGAPAPTDSGEDWHFGPCRMKNRKSELNARRSATIDWEPTEFDQFDEASPIFIMPVPGYQTNQNVSALTVLRQTARISQPLNRPYYNPTADVIDFIAPPLEAQPRRLDNGQLTSSDENRTHILNGALVPAVGGIKVSSEAVEQVTRLELAQRSNIDITAGQTRRRETDERSTPYNVVSKNAPQMTVSLTTDYGSGYDVPPQWGVPIYSIISGTYGMQTPGPLSWTVKRAAKRSPETVDRHARWFLTPFPPHRDDLDSPMVFQLMNSITNWAPGTGPFAIVGGVIEYTAEGWSATLNPAAVPTTGSARPLTTLGDITSTTRLSAASPDRLVVDLHKLDYN